MRDRIRKRSLRRPLMAVLAACCLLTAFGEISDQVDESYHEALRLASDGDLDSAFVILDQAVALEPRSPRVNQLLARLLIRANRLDEAESTLARLLEFRPDAGEPLYLKGLIALAREDSLAAMDLFERALADPRATRRR